MRINVLYISYDGMSEPLGKSQVIPYLEGLSKAGYSVHLISFEKPDVSERILKQLGKELAAVNIQWHALKYTKQPPVFSTIWDVRMMSKLAFSLHQKLDFKIVHCRSYLSAIVGLKLKNKRGVKFIFDIRGFWADERVDGGLWNLKNPIYKAIYKYFKRKEHQLFKQADFIVVLTEASRQHILTHHESQGRIPVIPCAADLYFYGNNSLRSRAECRKNLGVDNEFLLLYLGSLGTWYLLDEMLAFFIVLKKTQENAKFLFVTRENPQNIINAATKYKIQRSDIIIRQGDRSEIPKFLVAVDASVFFIKECFSKMASSPTKHGELLAAGIPTVCNDIGDLREIIEFENAGVLVDDFSRESLEKAVNLISGINKKGLMATAEKYYSLENGILSYQEIYRTLLSDPLIK